LNNNTSGIGELSAIAFNFRTGLFEGGLMPRELDELTASSGCRGNAGQSAGAGAKDNSDADAEWQIVQRPGTKPGAQHGSEGNSNASRHGEPG
jgi:hypothetical protein